MHSAGKVLHAYPSFGYEHGLMRRRLQTVLAMQITVLPQPALFLFS